MHWGTGQVYSLWIRPWSWEWWTWAWIWGVSPIDVDDVESPETHIEGSNDNDVFHDLTIDVEGDPVVDGVSAATSAEQNPNKNRQHKKQQHKMWTTYMVLVVVDITWGKEQSQAITTYITCQLTKLCRWAGQQQMGSKLPNTIFTQHNVAKWPHIFGSRGVLKELSQLHKHDVLEPQWPEELTPSEWAVTLAHVLKEKRNGEINSGGRVHVQRREQCTDSFNWSCVAVMCNRHKGKERHVIDWDNWGFHTWYCIREDGRQPCRAEVWSQAQQKTFKQWKWKIISVHDTQKATLWQSPGGHVDLENTHCITCWHGFMLMTL